MTRARLGVLGLAALPACADVLDIPDDPALIDAGRWRCLEQPARAPAPASDSALVQVAACDLASEGCRTPVTGLRARLCASPVDTDCREPVSTGIVDQSGLLSFSVPTTSGAFDGYLEVESAAELCTNPELGEQGSLPCGLSPECDPDAPSAACEVPLFVRALLFFNPPIAHDVVRPIPLPLVPSAALGSLFSTDGTTPDPGTGSVFMTALDCDGEPAAGVRWGVDRDEAVVTRRYWIGGEPSGAADETDGSGVGVFSGVPPGIVGLQASVAAEEGGLGPVGFVSVVTQPLSVSYGFSSPLGGGAGLGGR